MLYAILTKKDCRFICTTFQDFVYSLPFSSTAIVPILTVPSTPDGTGSTPGGTMTAVAAGALLLVAVITGIGACCYCRRRATIQRTHLNC